MQHQEASYFYVLHEVMHSYWWQYRKNRWGREARDTTSWALALSMSLS